MRIWMCLLVAGVVACGGKKKESEPAPGSGTAVGTGSGSAPVAEVGGVEVFVDGNSVAKVSPAELDAWPRLDRLVPEDARRLGRWDAIAFAGGGAPSELAKPSLNQPDKVPVLYRDQTGKAAFGMFDAVELAKRGEPAFKAEDIREVRITVSKMERGGEHQGAAGEGTDPTKLVVKITTPAGEKQITGPEILKLPREPQPGNEDTKGWRVTQFLEAAGVTSYDAITLVDANGTTVPLTKKELDPKKAIPFIKLNKQGALRFRMFTKQGDGWATGADLRSLVAIQVK